jgi:hypothetical protein
MGASTGTGDGGNNSNSGSRTWSDSQGSVTTNPDSGNITWSGGGNGQTAGSWNEATQTATGAWNTPLSEPVAVAPVAPPVDQFTRLKELSDMFNKENPMFAQTATQLPSVTGSLNQLVNSGPIGSEYSNPVVAGQDQNVSDNYNTYGTTTPNMWQKLGLVPGMTSENFFNRETPAQRDERMGMVSDGIGAVGRAIVGAAIPAPIRLGLGAYGAYKGYQADPNHDVGRAIATGVQSMPGYAGALGNLYNGNYGAALAGGLAKNGITGPAAGLAGIGADYASGKNVAPSLGGLAGQFVGRSVGGPLGGMFGRSLGQQMSRSSSIRK